MWFDENVFVFLSHRTNGAVKENDMMSEGNFGNTMNSSSRYHSISKQRNFQNPPSARAPSPPLQDNEMVSVVWVILRTAWDHSLWWFINSLMQNAKKSLRGIYSSNDSGFDNEIPPIAPEVDYSDDDDDDDDNDHLPQKVPIRCVWILPWLLPLPNNYCCCC